MYRCKHGTYIGDPYGPDYMCGRCEAGDDFIFKRRHTLSIEHRANRILAREQAGKLRTEKAANALLILISQRKV